MSALRTGMRYFFTGLLLAGLDLVLYGICYELAIMSWHNPIFAEEMRIFTPLIKVALLAIKVIIVCLFFFILFKLKSPVRALGLVLGYASLMLIFHAGLIPLEFFRELNGWFEIANLFAILVIGGMFITSLFVSGIYALYLKYRASTSIKNP